MSTESKTLDEVIRRLLPTVPPPKTAPIPSDSELLIQRLLGVIQERSKLTDMEIVLQNLLPVGSVMEEDGPSSETIAESPAGYFSCGELTHETDQCQELDESFLFLSVGWQADRIGDEFILRPGPTGALDRRLIRGEGLVARISNDYGPQSPVVWRTSLDRQFQILSGLSSSCGWWINWAPVVGRGVRPPCSDSDESDDDVLSLGPMQPLVTAARLGGTRGHSDDMIKTDLLRDEWSVDSWTAGDRHVTGCEQLDNFDWVMPAGYPVGVVPEAEEDDSLSDVEPDACDVPDVFPVHRETAAVESLCFPVVVQTRPQVIQLDNFDWVMPAGYPAGVVPGPEEDDSLSDLSQMPVMFRTYFRFVGKRRLWSRCVLSCGRSDETTWGMCPCLALSREQGTGFPRGG